MKRQPSTIRRCSNCSQNLRFIKIYIGLSESDGIGTSLLESIGMGAIPVHTSTSCGDEWFQDSGLLVSEISESAVAGAILQGVSLAGSQANSDENREIIRQRGNTQDMFAKPKTFYHLDWLDKAKNLRTAL